MNGNANMTAHSFSSGITICYHSVFYYLHHLILGDVSVAVDVVGLEGLVDVLLGLVVLVQAGLEVLPEGEEALQVQRGGIGGGQELLERLNRL